VYFATNRAKDKLRHYGDHISPRVAWGRCLVNIPVTSHQRGKLELPKKPRNWWQPVSGDFRKKYFHIESLDEMSFDSLRGKFSRGDVLLYVHGFANTFADAVLRAAQLRHDIEFRGPVAAFTWPADADIGGADVEKQYRRRESDAEQSVPRLVEVLRRLVQQQRTKGGGHKIHIIAHSLGCRVLVKAVSALKSSNSSGRKLAEVLGHIVLAAPDVDWPTFALHGPRLVAACQRVTYYYSTTDLVLVLSRTLHKMPPIGLSPLLHPGVGIINADNANNWSYMFGFGHSYYSSSNRVLTDLHLVLVDGLKPEDRQAPRGSIGNRQTIDALEHWEFIRKTGTP